MRAKAEIFFDAVTGIQEELVEEAQNHMFQKRRVRWRYAGLAACLALAVLLGYSGMLRSGGKDAGGEFNTSGALFGGQDADAPISADGCEPGDAAHRPTLGDGSPEEGGPVDAPASDPAPGGGPEERSITARALEVRDGWLLAEVLSGLEAERVEISLKGLEDLPAIRSGQRLTAVFTGEIQAGEVPRITGVIALVPEEQPADPERGAPACPPPS